MVASLEKNPGESVIGLPVWELIVGLQAGLFALFVVCFFIDELQQPLGSAAEKLLNRRSMICTKDR
jgi:hypothetical protein